MEPEEIVNQNIINYQKTRLASQKNLGGKRTAFANQIRRNKRQQQFKYLRFKRDNQHVTELLSSLIQNPKNISQIMKYKHHELQNKNEKELARLFKEWLYQNAQKFSSEFDQNLTQNQQKFDPSKNSKVQLSNWSLLIKSIIFHFPQQTAQILKISLPSMIKIAENIRNFQPIFILFKQLAIQVQYFPSKELQIIIHFKWNSQLHSDMISKSYTDKQLDLLIVLIQKFPKKSFQTFADKHFIKQIVLHMRQNLYQPLKIKKLCDILVQVIYRDDQKKFAKFIAQETPLLQYARFFISFSKFFQIIEGCCDILNNILIDNGINGFKQENLLEVFSQLLEQNFSKKQYRVQIQLRTLFFLCIMNLQTDQNFQYFNRIQGCETLAKVLWQDQYMKQKQIRQGLVLAITSLIQHGNCLIEANQTFQNIYKRQLESLNVIDGLKRFQQGEELLIAYWPDQI